jgi:hypothetical protein
MVCACPASTHKNRKQVPSRWFWQIQGLATIRFSRDPVTLESASIQEDEDEEMLCARRHQAELVCYGGVVSVSSGLTMNVSRCVGFSTSIAVCALWLSLTRSSDVGVVAI